MGGPEESVTDATPRSARSIGLPPGLDIADLTPYTQTNEQRCQALLYPHMLLLSWLAAGGGRGIVAVDLLNCTSVQSAATPTHPSARDDVGTIAAMRQSNEPDGQPLMDVLVPFHMLYADGVERLAAESVHERSKWVHRICELLPATPAPSRTQSPTGSMRTILSIDTTSSSSSVGSRSTVFVPPLSSIPDISDDFDTRSTFSRTNSFISTHHTGTVDDTAILGQGYVYRGDPRVIAPSRGGSLRRTSSLTDMDQEFASALDRARGARPGLGFASRVILGGSPVTVSSGSSLGKDVFVTPPPSARGSSTPHGSSTDLSDEAFFSAGSGTSDTRTTSLYTLTSTGRDRTITGFTSTGFTTTNTTTGLTSGDSDTNVVSSTLTYRRTDSASYLGDSHDSDSYFSSGSSRTPLTRSSALSRRTGRSNSRSNSSGFPYSSDEASDKENFRTLSILRRRAANSLKSAIFSPSSDVFASASEGSGSYVTAASPASTAFESLPSIPSESEYGTADEAASTEYATASEPSEYITAEVCPSEPGTEYLTAIEPREIPSELSTPKASSSLHLESDVEFDIEPDIAEEEQIEKELVLSDESPEEAETDSILPSPSEVPTIITTESEETISSIQLACHCRRLSLHLSHLCRPSLWTK
ncbi:acetyl-CoA carboxylase [Salix suchowensis]|nr:acetyl-CoA carboxylase [Salix suchowensis]